MVIVSKRQNSRMAGETFQTKSALHERVRQMLMINPKHIPYQRFFRRPRSNTVTYNASPKFK